MKLEKGVWDDFWVWGAPRYDGVQHEKLEALIDQAGDHGMPVYGEGTKARKAIEIYLVELFNRSVLDFVSYGGHERLEIASNMASEYNYVLPRFSLDLVDFAMIKIPLPDQDWFVLSMEDFEHNEETQENIEEAV